MLDNLKHGLFPIIKRIQVSDSFLFSAEPFVATSKVSFSKAWVTTVAKLSGFDLNVVIKHGCNAVECLGLSVENLWKTTEPSEIQFYTADAVAGRSSLGWARYNTEM
jgi:hypothetical protein